MVTVTLDDRDRAILERLREGAADVESLAESVDCSDEYLRDRLPELSDNGLVHTDEADGYKLTHNGERALAGSSAGTMDDRIDTPEAIEDRLGLLDLRPDREEAVRNAFAFLRYWGTASAGEIVDAVYSENPAGFESRIEWWDACVRDALATLPRVDPPDSSGECWRYDGTPIVEERTDDGRLAPDETMIAQSGATFALERLDLTEAERNAVRAAFDALVAAGELNTAELRDRIYPEHDAGYDSECVWWTDCIRDALASLPSVDRPGAPDAAWRYRQADDGPMTTNPGAELRDEPTESKNADGS